MNAIKRFIDLLKSPLIPVRLFAVEDDFDFSEFDDTPTGYYDTDGNYLGDDATAAAAAAASHDDSAIDPSNWAEYSDPDNFGDVSLQTDGNGNYTEAQYRDPETGEWKESNLSGYQEAYGHSSEGQTKQAVELFGANMTPASLAALNVSNKADVSSVLEAATAGNPAAVAMATAMTGTKPDEDSLKDLGYTDEQINTAMEFAEALAQAAAEGKSPQEAWKEASTKTGDPYGTNNRNTLLNNTIWSSIGLFGGPLAGAIAKGATITSAVGAPAALGSEIWTLLHTDKGKGTGLSSEGTRATEDKTSADTPASSKSESEPTSTSKSDPTFTNPFAPDISIPEGPLAGTPLSGTGLPGGETNPTKEEAEDRGFENDDSGSDTMEETSQDAPTSGLGGDTFSNPNDDTGRHGWGLGEEDPNRANYDNDKWNRGMERVSTDVVSDEKCKAFIKKTFKNDPVLIKTVRIMKSL